MSRHERLSQIMKEQFSPSYLLVENESHKHSVPAHSETHFQITCISDQFAGLSRVQRQQKVYQACQNELKTGLHALSLRTFTPEEWQSFGEKLDGQSPDCEHKRKHDL